VTRSRHVAVVATAILFDLLAVSAGFLLPALLRFSPAVLLEAALAPSGAATLALGALLWVAMLSARDAYGPRVMVSKVDQALRVLEAGLAAWVLTHLLAFVTKTPVPFESRLAVGLSLPLVLAALTTVRLALVRPLARRTYERLTRGPRLVVGDSERAERLAVDLEERDPEGRPTLIVPLAPVSVDDASRLVEAYGFGEVLIEPTGRSLEEVLDIAFAFLDARVDVRVVSNRFEIVVGRSAIGVLDGVPVIRFRRFDLAGPEVLVKRLVDVVGAALGLVLLSPVLAGIAIAIRATSPGPVLFRQERVGQGGRAFTMLKFRTMEHGNDPKVHQDYLREYMHGGEAAAAEIAADGTRIYKLTRDPRVTPLGAWLRALSLDELPQLWNVLRGQMSLVGPRPCMPFEWTMYRPWQKRRLDVKPGCTGLWQVTARSRVGFEEMVILDLHYAHHGSIGGDLGLIARTVPAMLRGRGGY
jgi:exopolysaccharide biosynthesis polyprenyl glycosylphosphotransferase